MIMKKKLLTVLLALVLCVGVVGMAACGDDDSKPGGTTIKLKIWGAQQDQAMLNTMADDFKTQYPNEKFKFEFGVVGEPDAAKNVTDDISVAADVFMFSDDQMRTLVSAQALYEITDVTGVGNFKSNAIERNTAASIEFATFNEKLYALPATADNTFFMYYDKRYVKEADLANLDTVLAACATSGKDFIMDLSDGWYMSSFFFSAGCSIGVDANGKQTCDFNNENGIKAAQAADKLATHERFRTGDNSIITGNTGIGGTSTEKSGAVAISGSWNATAIKKALGENFGVCALPKIKIGDSYVTWKNFGGCKLAGVKRTTAQPKWALTFAEFITNEANQVKRFEVRGFGPSNKNAANNATIKADPVVSAITAQMVNSVTQRDALSNFWTPTEGLGTAMEATDHKTVFTAAELKAKLDDMVAQITA